MDSPQAIKLFDALASEIRLDIFRLLIRHAPEGLVAGEIGQRLGIPANNLTFHLKALGHSGLVEQERRGRFLHCRANVTLMVEVVAFLLGECCGGDSEQHRAMLAAHPALAGLLASFTGGGCVGKRKC